MTQVNADIILKKSSTSGEVPADTDLEVAEVAVNTADAKLFTKHTDGSVKEIGGAVASVNGETGDVSLGIQDMDDYTPNFETAGQPIGTWVADGTDDLGGMCGDVGRATYSTFMSAGKVSAVDSDGVDRSTELAAIDNTPGGYYIEVDGVAQEITSTTREYSASTCSYFFGAPGYPSGWAAGTEIKLYAVGELPSAPIEKPLLDGEFVGFDSSKNKFRPILLADVATSGSYNDLTDQPVISGGVITWEINATGNASYDFTGPGFPSPASNPALTVSRGQTYVFNNVSGAHPFQIQSTSGVGGTAYNDGVTGNGTIGEVTFVVPMDAPAELFYQCTSHSAMNGTIAVLENSSSGAVDSVNGETGVVSLGIQDMDDFALNIDVGTHTIVHCFGTEGNQNALFDNVATWVGLGYDNISFNQTQVDTDGTTGSPATFFSNTWNNYTGTLWMTFDDPTTNADPFWYSVSVSGRSIDSGVVYRFNNAVWSPSMPSLSSPTWWTEFDPTGGIGVPIQLASEDILQYDGSVFKPAQLAAVATSGSYNDLTDLPTAGAVDSVNGEIGAVSLGIQDMDDFELNQDTGSIVFRYTYGGIGNPTPYPANGTWTTITFERELRFAGIDADGNDITNAANARSCDGNCCPGWWSQDQVNWTALPTANGSTICSSSTYEGQSGSLRADGTVWWKWGMANDYTQQIDNGQDLYLMFSDPASSTIPDIPLAEDDVLRWNDLEQVFKPAQLAAVATSGSYNDLTDLPSGGGGAVDSVNGETGVVSLGIQDMDDFQYLPVGGASWELQIAGGASPVPGFCYSASSYSRFNYTDSNGNDTTAAFQTLQAGDSLLLAHYDAPGGNLVASYVSTITSIPDPQPDPDYFQVAHSADNNMKNAPNGSHWVISNPGFAASLPLAEGDILQWNNAEQKFKPARAVDSVNGETGVVSLGIQDMDDFEPAQQAGVLILPDKVGSITGSSATEWYVSSTGSSVFYSELQTILTDNLSDGDEITMQVPGMTGPFTTTLTNDPANGAKAGSKYFNISPSAPAEIINAVDGTYLTITSSNLPGSPLPLVEGDILQWNNAEQKFKPAQLPASGGAVDSVNGETGVVSLGIQDMDDYKPAPAAGQLTQFDSSFESGETQPAESPSGSSNPSTGGIDGGAYVNNGSSVSHFLMANVLDVTVNTDEVWDVFAIAFRSTSDVSTSNRIWLAGNKDQAAGSGWALYTRNSGIAWHYNTTYAEWGNANLPLAADTWHTALIQIHWPTGRGNAPSIQVWIDGSAIDADETARPAVSEPDASDDWYFSSDSSVSTDFDHLAYLSSSVQVVDPIAATVDWTRIRDSLEASAAPLVDGDILQWVAAESKFKPATVANSVNGETGVVSLGIQDMNDYGLRPNYSSVYSFNYASYNSSNTSWDGADGEWGDTTSSGFIRLTFSGVDANGVTVPHPDDVNAAWWYSTDNGNTWTSVSSQTWVSLGSAFTVQQNPSIARSGNLQITWTDPSSAATLPVADGDVLQYVAAESEFKPTALAAVATSGSYNDLTDQPVMPGPAPVDSVNGETGTVSLGIQDMDDFALLLSPGSTWNHTDDNSSNTDVSNSGATNGKVTTDQDGASYNQYTLWVGDVDSDGINRKADMLQAIADGAVISVYYDGVLAFTDTVTSPGGSSNQYGRVALSFAGGSFFFPPSIGTVVGLTLPGSPTLPLAEDDFLQWDNTASKFKPTQLATVATSGSYNDLADQPVITDTNRIQDQTDFALNQLNGQLTYSSFTTNNEPLQDNEVGFQSGAENNNSFSYLNLSNVSDQGNVAALLAGLNGSTVTLSRGATSAASTVFGVSTTNPNYVRLYVDKTIFTLALKSAIDAELGVITIASPALGTVDIQLTNNDILRYDSGNQKFQPAQLAPVAIFGEMQDLNDVDLFTTPVADGDILQYDAASGQFLPVDGISLTALKDVVAQSSDFADFQSRIAAL